MIDDAETRPPPRFVARALLVGIVCWLAAACAASSSVDQIPTGGRPAVTVLMRVRSPDGPEVQLLAKGVPQPALDEATSAVARAVFPGGAPGVARASTTTVARVSASAVPITISDEAQTLTVTSQQIDYALSGIDPPPRSVAVWACTDDRRTIQVTTQAPGAVPSDVASGSCKPVGTSLADDRGSWTSTVAVGALQPPSLLPVAVVTSIVLVLLALAIAYLRGRAAAREAEVSAESSEPSVH